VTEAGQLVLLAERATSPPSLAEAGLVVDRARYDTLAALAWDQLLAQFPGIAAGPRVSMTRWMHAP